MPVAELRNVVKRFGAVTALDGVSLGIGRGELVALLGPNGAGKTTAVRILLGLAAPTSGEAVAFGVDPRERSARMRTGAQLQVARVPETLRVREHIELFSSYYPAPMPVEETIAAAGLAGFEKRRFGDLSGGERQRVLFALAICGNPDLLYLDEPTVGLDVEARRIFWQQIRLFVARRGSVLLTTHYLEEADALADRIAIINHGRVVAEGTPAQIKTRTAAKKIRCTTVLDERTLRSLDGFTRLTLDGGRAEILTPHPERVLGELLARDPSLTDLEVAGSGLEEAFIALTEEVAK